MGHDENMVKSNLFYLLLSILRNKRLNDVHFRDFFMHHTYTFFEKNQSIEVYCQFFYSDI